MVQGDSRAISQRTPLSPPRTPCSTAERPKCGANATRPRQVVAFHTDGVVPLTRRRRPRNGVRRAPRVHGGGRESGSNPRSFARDAVAVYDPCQQKTGPRGHEIPANERLSSTTSQSDRDGTSTHRPRPEGADSIDAHQSVVAATS